MYYIVQNGRITCASDYALPGAEQTDRNIVRAWDGNLYFEDETPAEPLERIIDRYDSAIDARLEDFARQLYSKGLVNAIGYTSSKNPVWRMEAEFLSDLRDTVHETNFNTLNEFYPRVLAGEIPVPSFAEITADLPELKWPQGSRGHDLPALPWVKEEEP